jgi:hypothetical protein
VYVTIMDERVVTIMDERVVWPAVTVDSRYLNVGMRPDVARAFCDWHEAWLIDQATQHAAACCDDPRDVESDHVYYAYVADGGPAVYRLIWDVDGPEYGFESRPAYDLVIEPFVPYDDGTSRVWIGANYWMWEYANQKISI